MHDSFDILGLPASAGAEDIRRARRRQIRRTHPDYRPDDSPGLDTPAVPPDTALDFVDIRPVVERMCAAFLKGAA